MTDGKNIGRWVPYLGKLVRVYSNASDIILYGKLIGSNYGFSKFLPYTSIRSTPLEDRMGYITSGDPRIVKEDSIRDVELISESYVKKIIMDLEKLNKDKKLKREKEELSDKLAILEIKQKIKILEKQKKKVK